ncbi:hypothetical protein G0Q06_00890 [Puniceicoccales bacterium CK1056]|uniref:Glycoside hydrolase family 42 N-terminal domain-containing protein n=1 Tax=Oceanipulchritudo coccoides TaxID=2706888 RepID=A0A6B2LWW1_9BACT|nr:beta-galactosidase [Oceanipulchritudo coccoides]NDV60998.1 hypothetical protein [Oceanipulchritudo coccoides]
MKNTLLIAILLAAFFTGLQAQDRDDYGIWARGNRYEQIKFPFKGIEASPAWSDIEPNEGEFNWSEVDEKLEEAEKLGLYVLLSINVGPDAPNWLYEKDVEKVMTEGHRHSGPYPEYTKPVHIQHYYRLIEEFGRHVRSLPAGQVKRISSVQVKTGATGDESPHKGDLLDDKFEISNKAWTDFRLAAFKKFQHAFQEGAGPVIPLMFTSVVGEKFDPSLIDWISDNVKGGWGTKMGGTGQGYQINDEVNRTAAILPHTIDPAPDTWELFTRCEMDQGWKEGIYKKNIKQAFYWTSLSALHSGLSMWNMAQSALDWHQENNFWVDALFFNEYAGQTHSTEATGAFCALREGLDSSDTEKFPEAEFGNASIKNADRYLAICVSRSAYGAKMDDVSGVLAGMMKQRRGQEGLNDAGWGIFRGNYERFLHQIDADKTSVGWWRVGGAITPDSPIYGRFARGFEHASGKDRMGFDIKDTFFSGQPLAGAYPIKVRIVYYDKGHGQWALNYDATDNSDKRAATITNTDSREWKEIVLLLKDAQFGNRGPNGADLSLINTDDEDDIFHIVEIGRPPQQVN